MQKNKELKLSGFEECLHGSVSTRSVEDFKFFLTEKNANPFYEKNGKDIVSKISELEFFEERRLHEAIDNRDFIKFSDAINNGANFAYQIDGMNAYDKLNNTFRNGNYIEQTIAFAMYNNISYDKIRQTDCSKIAKQMSKVLFEHETTRTQSLFNDSEELPKLPSAGKKSFAGKIGKQNSFSQTTLSTADSTIDSMQYSNSSTSSPPSYTDRVTTQSNNSSKAI